MATPQVGEMILYDYIRPPLEDGEYRLSLSTEVAYQGAGQPLDARDMFFDVEGPRFSLSASEVSGVFPPRNGHGSFDSALPHVALGRRTLPWERPLAHDHVAPPGQTPFPWLALVLFEEGEYTLLHDQPLQDNVPRSVFQALGSPAIRCDFVQADAQLLKDILPMPSELQLLTHVRQVNVQDRELAAGDSDGFFAVVMSNRVPRAGAKHLACLVSVEERTDLLPTTDTVVVGGVHVLQDARAEPVAAFAALGPGAISTPILPAEADAVTSVRGRSVGGAASLELARVSTSAELTASSAAVSSAAAALLHPSAQLVLLHSWIFTCEGEGTFRERLQHIDVGMIGDVAVDSGLDVTDTGHIRIDVTDRLGAPERAWFRGPIVPQPLTRDALGPYHSADQARRLVADTGAEDVSYAAAFEVGRLLAAADARLAQELQRWRRGAYSQSARTDVISLVAKRLHILDALEVHVPLSTRLEVHALAQVARGAGPLVDRFGVAAVESSPLLRPDAVQHAFGLETPDEADALLGRTGALDTPVSFTPPDHAQVESFDDVLRDEAGQTVLQTGRSRLLDNVKLRFVPGRTS